MSLRKLNCKNEKSSINSEIKHPDPSNMVYRIIDPYEIKKRITNSTLLRPEELTKTDIKLLPLFQLFNCSQKLTICPI